MFEDCVRVVLLLPELGVLRRCNEERTQQCRRLVFGSVLRSHSDVSCIDGRVEIEPSTYKHNSIVYIQHCISDYVVVVIIHAIVVPSDP